MNQIQNTETTNVLRPSEDNGLMFRCPGCNHPHVIKYGEGRGARWAWNGDMVKPTFHPSYLISWTEPSDNPEEFDDTSKDLKKICHSFIVDGNIQFLNDCTHHLAGQTVPLGIMPSDSEDW